MKRKIILCITLGFVVFTFYSALPTLRGLYLQKFAFWEEYEYLGKPLRDLEELLRRRGTALEPVLSTEVYDPDHPGLQTNQSGFKFRKGERYKWFPIGSAVNEGYVVVEERPGGAVVIDIIRRRSVDSL